MGRTTWLASLALGALVGCAGAEAMTLAPQPSRVRAMPVDEVGLHPGESMAFEVRLGGVLAGEAELAVGELGQFEGHRAVVVKSRAATAGAAALIDRIVDESTTVVDMDSGRPLAVDTFVEQRGKTTTAHATFTGRVASVTYAHPNDPHPHTYKIDFGAIAVQDTLSAMAQLRGWRAPPGTQRSVYVIGGRQLWRVDVRFVGTETIGSVLGNRRAIHFDGASYRTRPNVLLHGQKPARTFSVWLSDDADRVPLKMTAKTELGEVTMQLTQYDRP